MICPYCENVIEAIVVEELDRYNGAISPQSHLIVLSCPHCEKFLGVIDNRV